MPSYEPLFSAALMHADDDECIMKCVASQLDVRDFKCSLAKIEQEAMSSVIISNVRYMHWYTSACAHIDSKFKSMHHNRCDESWLGVREPCTRMCNNTTDLQS